MKTGNIRILKTGLTVGSAMFTEGDLVAPREHNHTLIQLADGRRHDGALWAEWEMAPEAQHTPMTEPVSAPEPQPAEVAPEPAAAEAPEPVAEVVMAPAPEPAPAPVDLAKAIKDLVRAGGMGKTAIIKQLAEPEGITQRQVQAVFDTMLATGQVVATGEAGVYKVQD